MGKSSSCRRRCRAPPSRAAMASKVQKIMTQPINLIFRFLQNKTRVQIWLYENTDMRIEGRIIGFDEYMNLVLDEAEEMSIKKKSRKPLGNFAQGGQHNAHDECRPPSSLRSHHAGSPSLSSCKAQLTELWACVSSVDTVSLASA